MGMTENQELSELKRERHKFFNEPTKDERRLRELLYDGSTDHAARDTVPSLDQVAEFHAAFDVRNGAFPGDTPEPAAELRFKLIAEELTELRDAWAQRDMVEVLDALTDLQYVLDGAYLAFGMAPLKNRAFAEVHRSNMTKLGPDGKPVIRADGKVTKGPNYEPPRLAPFLARLMELNR